MYYPEIFQWSNQLFNENKHLGHLNEIDGYIQKAFCPLTNYTQWWLKKVCNVNHLYFQELGHEFKLNGEAIVMFGTIAAISADNLGSLALGGFKESCSTYWICRHCMATREESKSNVSLVQKLFSLAVAAK